MRKTRFPFKSFACFSDFRNQNFASKPDVLRSLLNITPTFLSLLAAPKRRTTNSIFCEFHQLWTIVWFHCFISSFFALRSICHRCIRQSHIRSQLLLLFKWLLFKRFLHISKKRYYFEREMLYAKTVLVELHLPRRRDQYLFDPIPWYPSR